MTCAWQYYCGTLYCGYDPTGLITGPGWDEFGLQQIPSQQIVGLQYLVGFDPNGEPPVWYVAGIAAANLLDFASTDGPTVTPATYQDVFDQGYNAALKDLNRKKCGSFFGGKGPATINSTWYRFLDFGTGRANQGAQTSSPTDVQINSTGPYITFVPTPGTRGPSGLFWTQSQFRAFILLHELGHQLSPITGFQSDAGNPSLNQRQSMKVIGPCIK